jgi:hypothetical protein
MFSEWTLNSTNKMPTLRQTLILDATAPSTPQSAAFSPMTINEPISKNATEVCD